MTAKDRLERQIVQHFGVVTTLAVVVAVAVAVGVVARPDDTLDQVEKAADALVKGAAIIVGALWSLNRYFVARTDYPQLRVTLDVDSIPADGSLPGSASKHPGAVAPTPSHGLLAYRLDVLNTGKILLPVHALYVDIHAVTVDGATVSYEPLYRWPEHGAHPSAPIEPGAWTGISDAIPCPLDVRAIRVFVEVFLHQRPSWTWHRIVVIRKELPPAVPAPAAEAHAASRSPARRGVTVYSAGLRPHRALSTVRNTSRRSRAAHAALRRRRPSGDGARSAAGRAPTQSVAEP
ncbi:hypothetical protein J421_5708 (plasmid) [Gemmatirosa kalamazoonensis]|uniref:Uncharacterized protein n=1 Tax=Gemmatirosa kalamazoonensis TaxID=861299 RepID=W0RUK8_9BACT|nr:hypothetical protein [Gemmatirosa kalamazoonensis]AHG93243.1 hypothetical protein J421_5708 [Gemmatirosa kalamazoonensis]